MAKKKKVKGQEKLFNPLKRKVLRKKIPQKEVAFGVGFVGFMGAVGGWVLAQQDNFDPAERDISTAALAADSSPDTLYRQPLKPWVEPGSASAVAAGPDLMALPESIIADGWQLDGRVERYVPDTLYEKINGAAELYLRFGFSEMRYVTLALGAALVTLELYDQGTLPNALGLFDSIRDPAKNIETLAGTTFYRTSVGAIGRRGAYVFKISGNEATPLVTAKADQLMEALQSVDMDDASKPAGLRLFEEIMALPPDRVGYEKQDVFQYAFMKDVWFARQDDGKSRFFFHQADDDDMARTRFDSLVKEQLAEHDAIRVDKDEALMKHRFLNTVFAVAIDGRDIFGVEGGSDTEQAEAALTTLNKARPEN